MRLPLRTQVRGKRQLSRPVRGTRDSIKREVNWRRQPVNKHFPESHASGSHVSSHKRTLSLQRIPNWCVFLQDIHYGDIAKSTTLSSGYPVPGKTTIHDTSETIDPAHVHLDGGILIKILVLSIDPFLRNLMNPPVPEDGIDVRNVTCWAYHTFCQR